jgi:hypothetical protein
VKIALAIAAACGAIFAASSTQAATVKDIFENHGLLGTLAADSATRQAKKLLTSSTA